MTQERKKAPGNKDKLIAGGKKGVPTPNMIMFVNNIKLGMRNAEAAEKAGYSKASAAGIANGLLKKQWVIDELQAWKDSIVKTSTVTHERITNELEKWAFFNPFKFFDVAFDPLTKKQSFILRDLKDLQNDEVGSVVKGLKYNRFGQMEVIFKSAETAIEMLARHTGYFKEDNEQKKDEGVQIYLPDNERGDA